MKLFKITTNGLCLKGTAIVLAESDEHAKQEFKKILEDESNYYEDEIIDVKEINMNNAQVIYYDDGDR